MDCVVVLKCCCMNILELLLLAYGEIIGLPMTRIELEKVADVFFPDRRALHLVDVSEIVAKLTQKHDWKKVENESDAVKIEREVSLTCDSSTVRNVHRSNERFPSVHVHRGLRWSRLERENIALVKHFATDCCT